MARLVKLKPPVSPHGKRKWPYSKRFRPLFQAPTELEKYIPDFEHELFDLSVIPDEEIRGQVIVRVIQLVLKHIFDDDLGSRLPGILQLATDVFQQGSGLQMLVAILRYVSSAAPGMTDEALRKAVEVAFPKEGGILKQTLADQWLNQGRKEGREEGREEGLEAQRNTLILLLRHRFQLSESDTVRWRQQFAKIDSLLILQQLINDTLLAKSLDEFAGRLAVV